MTTKQTDELVRKVTKHDYTRYPQPGREGDDLEIVLVGKDTLPLLDKMKVAYHQDTFGIHLEQWKERFDPASFIDFY